MTFIELFYAIELVTLNKIIKPTLRKTDIEMITLLRKAKKFRKIIFFQSEVLFHLRVVEKLSKVWVKEI